MSRRRREKHADVAWRGRPRRFVAVFVLSLGAGQLLHMLAIYPPWNEPMRDPMLNLLALPYRIVCDTFDSYLTARLAPAIRWVTCGWERRSGSS
jgi:hypothetical protein